MELNLDSIELSIFRWMQTSIFSTPPEFCINWTIKGAKKLYFDYSLSTIGIKNASILGELILCKIL